MPELCLLQVHAHPDDEASKGAGTTAKYAAEGVRTVLVCCTGGEAGDILNPAVDTPEVRANLHAVRMAELQASVDAIGYSSLHMLGYRDSGMPDTDENRLPDNFANAPLEEAVGRFVRIIRAERPQVIITYRDEQLFSSLFALFRRGENLDARGRLLEFAIVAIKIPGVSQVSRLADRITENLVR